MKTTYRDQVRVHLKHAKEELSNGLSNHVKFAALELRMALETLTYERAEIYIDELPLSEYDTWQPRKLMLVLLEIDPNADKDGTLAVGLEKEYGVPSKEMKLLGTETVISMKVIKKHYDALGSYLHVQTIKQRKTGKSVDYSRFRNRCEKIVEFIEQILASPVYNVSVKCSSSIKCFNCNNPIHKRVPIGEQSIVAECHNCSASYAVTNNKDGSVNWKPLLRELECISPNCHETIKLWERDIKLGKQWRCEFCGGLNQFVMAIQHHSKPK